MAKYKKPEVKKPVWVEEEKEEEKKKPKIKEKIPKESGPIVIIDEALQV